MLTLTEYLKETDERPLDFARRAGLAPSSVTRYCRGDQIPGRDAMTRIWRATGGRVAPNAFYVLPDLGGAGACHGSLPSENQGLGMT